MYSTCLFCTKPLGANEVVETFPIGRRLAFDQVRARLWVVCKKCERWNLSPFEERWEAIEDCERLFRDAKKRASSDNIGLATLDEGLELVRIGEPLRPEFAAWRYGDQFGRRRRKSLLVGAGIAALGGVIVVAGATTGFLAGGGWWMYQIGESVAVNYRRKRVIARIPTEDGRRLTVRGKHLSRTRLLDDRDSEDGWVLELRHEDGDTVLTGAHALNATGLLMPKVNGYGASKRRVQDAVRQIEAHSAPDQFLRATARDFKKRAASRKKYGISKLPLETRLAIEMAVNEEHERIALEGELALLELDWKEAEEIAGIADSLAVPIEVEDRLEQLKQRAGPKEGDTT